MSITHKKLFKSPIAIGIFLSMNFSIYDCQINKIDCIVPTIKEKLLLILVNSSVLTDELVSIVATPLTR